MTTDGKHNRDVTRLVRGQPTSDGAGVKLTRVIGTQALPQLDPFLLLDEFGSDDPSAYIAGFPNHPHRGFETVTYMLEGRMRHRDNKGNEGVLESGGVQWMTAGRGIVTIGGIPLDEFHLGELSPQGDAVEIVARTGAVLLFGHCAPIGEPVVSYGPFVMNTAEEIQQAISDYQSGKLS